MALRYNEVVKSFHSLLAHLCLVRGIFTQLAAATAIKGTHRARRGGAV